MDNILLVQGRLPQLGRCSCSVAQSCPTLRDLMNCSTPGTLSFTSSRSLLKLMSIELVMLSNHLILYCPILLLPLIFPSIVVFSNELVFHIRWPKYWSFSFSISPANDSSRSVSFRIDWSDLLAVQGTLVGVLSSTTIRMYQCFGAQPSLWSNSHVRIWLLENP